MKLRFICLTIKQRLYYCSEDYQFPSEADATKEAKRQARAYREPVEMLLVYDNDRMIPCVVAPGR